MGYFDKAIAARDEIIEVDEEEYLAHGRFGSFRKAHKYIDRVWKNGKWVYRYKITGKGYKDLGDRYANIAGTKQENNPRSDEYRDKMLKKADEMRKKAESESVLGKVKNALTPKTSVTVSSNLMPAGTKKVIRDDNNPSNEGKYFTKKKKTLKHDDLHETVALGEHILSDFFGR